MSNTTPSLTLSTPLTTQHLDEFVETGCLHLKRFIPSDLAHAAEEAIWRVVPQKRDQPENWPEGWTQPAGCWGLPEVQACFITPLIDAIDQLVGFGMHNTLRGNANSFGPIILFPQRDKTWRPPSPHIDQHGPMHRTFVLGIIAYTHDVPTRCGATALWPRAFKDLEDAALRLNKLPADVITSKSEFTPPADFYEAAGSIGDVLLFTRNGLHSSTLNLSDRPRVAMQTMVHLNAQGEAHCRNCEQPRTPIERIYDRHYTDYHLFNYFGCRAKNQGEA
jgi:hypothetical protein